MIRHHTVVETEVFAADARHLKVSEEDITRIITEISINPEAGDLIANSGGLRKIRIAGRSGGKSGGYRILVLYLNQRCPTYLFAMLSKGERANFSKAELAELRKLASETKRYWKEQT